MLSREIEEAKEAAELSHEKRGFSVLAEERVRPVRAGLCRAGLSKAWTGHPKMYPDGGPEDRPSPEKIAAAPERTERSALSVFKKPRPPLFVDIAKFNRKRISDDHTRRRRDREVGPVGAVMTRAEEKAIKDELIGKFIAEKNRRPSSDQIWIRFWADPRVIAYQARRQVEMAEAKRYWDTLQRQQEAKK